MIINDKTCRQNHRQYYKVLIKFFLQNNLYLNQAKETKKFENNFFH